MKSMILFQVLLLSASVMILVCGRASASHQKTIGVEVEVQEAIEVQTDKDAKVSFDLLAAPHEVSAKVPFKIRLIMHNPTGEDLEVDAWSYVYRSSKCFSGEREANRKTINLPQYSNVTFDLENTVDADPGEYSLKVKFLRADRKTAFEIKRPIAVVENSTEDGAEDPSHAEDDYYDLSFQIEENRTGEEKSSRSYVSPTGLGVSKNASTPEKRTITPSSATEVPEEFSTTVFESSSARARRYAGYFLIVTLTLILIALIMRKF